MFVHIKAFTTRKRRPLAGDAVTYAVARDAQGRLRAEIVAIAGLTAQRSEKSVGPPILFALGFFALLGWWVAGAKLPSLVILVYGGASLCALVIYAIDKSAAEAGEDRVPEKMLHLVSLVCGWPGALIARHLLRHKTVKQPFRTYFWATVVLNCLLLAWMFTPQGQGYVWSIHYRLGWFS